MWKSIVVKKKVVVKKIDPSKDNNVIVPIKLYLFLTILIVLF